MRLSRRASLVLLAGAIAAFTAVMVRNRLTEAPTAITVAPVTRVVVAKRDLAVGTFVQAAQDLDWGPAPDFLSNVTNLAQPPNANPDAPVPPPPAPAQEAPKESYLYEGGVKLSDFNGAVVRRSLHAADAVPQGALMKSGEGGFMSAVLEAGMRAVSIGVTATSGNGGFVSPGDRVDLLVTHRIKMPASSNNSGNEEFVASETFVRDVRIVAVDQMIDNPENKAILAKTVTIEVTPRQAEEIAVAEDLGKISIALRSLTKPDSTPAEKNSDGVRQLQGAVDVAPMMERNKNFTRDTDISSLMVRKQGAGSRVHVIHGDKTESVDFDQDKQ